MPRVGEESESRPDFLFHSARQSLMRAVEPLWIAALGAQFIVLGNLLLPRLIRMLGRGGAVETVEWAIYMSMLFLFPPAVWIVGWVVPRLAGPRVAMIVRRDLVLLLALELAVYVVRYARVSLVIGAIAASLFAFEALTRTRLFPPVLQRMTGGGAGRSLAAQPAGTPALAVMCGAAAWMVAGSLVFWRNALQWMFASPVRFGILAATLLVVTDALRRWANRPAHAAGVIRVLDFVPLLVLIAFSFRTFPVVEHYHWGFFIGPIEQLRQGGTLLWDTPSQYGFLSILVPSLLPGNAWQSFWLFQGIAYAIVACMMYLAIRRTSTGWPSAAMAFVVTFAVLFFRPRSDALILPAQMTPAAGPFRFIWCFVLLAFLVKSYRDTRLASGSLRFAITGTVIWVVSLLWSAETGIYVTGMWFPALLIHALQTAAPGNGESWRPGTVAKLAVIPVAATLLAGAVVFGAYFLMRDSGPDLFGHFEYVLLYSRGGFGALPIDPSGTIWYLVISFLIISTILALHALRNPRDPRLVVWAAAWGCVWAVASYFTGRSHPVNLIALIPMLIFALVACMRLQPFDGSVRTGYVMAASVLPLFVMPVVVAVGHGRFAAEVSQAHLPPSRFVEQVQPMDESLQSLLVTSGARPDDSFVLVGDGRLMLPAWGRSGVISTRSWLPKPFEIIGSLPEARRQVYLERNSASFPGPGWLVQSKPQAAAGADHLLRFLESTRREERRFENDKWVLSWMGPVTREPE